MTGDQAGDDASGLRAEFDRMVDYAHRMDALAEERLIEATRLRSVVEQAITELDAEHYPTWASPAAHEAGKQPIGCALCWPGDGSWPCASRMIADDLRHALSADAATDAPATLRPETPR